MTDRSRVAELLANEVRFDALTGLPNRIVFQERLDAAIARAERTGKAFAVLFVDLDRFKAVNEALGHNIGDLFLQTASERIRLCIGEDAMLARYGGDQFVIVMPTDPDGIGAANLSRTIVEQFTRPVVVNARQIFATVSVGLTIAPDDGLDADRVIGNAGTALHDAKDLGGNGFRRYDSRRRDHASDRFAIETDLRRTVGAEDELTNDLAREGFVLHYQPIIAAGDERIVGAEALIRWNHPLRKLVPPDAFIPLAEQTGLIIKIGEWVFRTALLQVRAWDAAGVRLDRLAVNISARQFHHSNLVEMVERLLGETGVDANRVELELTETVVMRDIEATIVTLSRLKALGVHLSIDDFGTGYSSLAYLKRFPIDTLKIDRSFTRDASNGSADAAIVGTIVSLGHSLHKRVVAEGVETRGQIDFLRSVACDEFQGLLLQPALADGRIRVVLPEPDASAAAGSTGSPARPAPSGTTFAARLVSGAGERKKCDASHTLTAPRLGVARMLVAAFSFASFFSLLFGAFHFPGMNRAVTIPIEPFAVKRAVTIPIEPFTIKKSPIKRAVTIPIEPF